MERGEGHIGCWCGNMMERNHLEDLIIDRRIMLKEMLKKYHGSAWTGLMSQDRNKWQALVDTITSLQVPSNVNNFLSS